jgi:hypothetical protein
MLSSVTLFSSASLKAFGVPLDLLIALPKTREPGAQGSYNYAY